jgi:hypothetical protein
MLTARLAMSAICIVFCPLVPPADETKKLNGTSHAIAVTGVHLVSAARLHFHFHPNGRSQPSTEIV